MLHTPPRPLVYAPPQEPRLALLHEDAHILVLDKPSGLLTAPGNGPGQDDCLEARVRGRYPQATMVHRLDCDTSGVIVFALSRAAHRHLGLQFERRKLSKTYLARVWGAVAGESGSIDWPLATDAENRPKQKIDHDRGRAAVTHWRVIAREAGVTRLRLIPLTGRSHQLRVHMAAMGHPILGDNLYAPDTVLAAAPRLQLHAETLTLRHPDGGEEMTFAAECPF